MPSYNKKSHRRRGREAAKASAYVQRRTGVKPNRAVATQAAARLRKEDIQSQTERVPAAVKQHP